MPEPDTFDLDAAFARLERDVADSSVPRGAGAAITTARRRRRTTIGAAAAVVLVAVGAGALVTTYDGHRAEPAPTVDLSDRPVPGPAALDATSLGRATAGWAGPWDNLDMTASPQRILGPTCRINNDQSGSESVSGSSGAYQTADGHYAEFGAIRWKTGLRTYLSTFTKALKACPGATTTEVTYADGTRVLFVELPSLAGNPTQWAVVARGHDVLELQLAPTTDLPDDVQVRLADAMVAGLESDTGLTSVPQRGVVRSLQPEGFARFDSARMHRALGSWQSGWRDGQPDGYPSYSLLHDPCGSTAWAQAGKDTPVGANARFWIHQFSSKTAAETGYQRIGQPLLGCPGYTVKTVTTPGGADVLVARGDEDVWVTRYDDWVVAIYVPRAPTSPPDSVAVRMRSAMVGVVDDALAAARRAGG